MAGFIIYIDKDRWSNVVGAVQNQVWVDYESISSLWLKYFLNWVSLAPDWSILSHVHADWFLIGTLTGNSILIVWSIFSAGFEFCDWPVRKQVRFESQLMRNQWNPKKFRQNAASTSWSLTVEINGLCSTLLFNVISNAGSTGLHVFTHVAKSWSHALRFF